MKPLARALWILGVISVLGLVAYYGFSDMVHALSIAGWGLVWVSAYNLVPLFADTKGWGILIQPRNRPSFLSLLWARWICSAINSLLPVGQVGGDFIRARLLTKKGVSGPESGASVVVDITISILTQIVFSIFGVLFLVYLHGIEHYTFFIIVGILFFALLILGFYLVQRTGLFLKLVNIFKGFFSGFIDSDYLLGNAIALDAAIDESYQRTKEIIGACWWRMLGWVAGTGEIWIALYFLGHPIGIFEAFILESIGQAIRSSAFMIPGAYGVQEGGYILLGCAVGLNPEIGLALSLVKRVREFLVGLPALIAWQIKSRKKVFGQASPLRTSKKNG